MQLPLNSTSSYTLRIRNWHLPLHLSASARPGLVQRGKMLLYSFHFCLSICDSLDLGQEDKPYLKINESQVTGTPTHMHRAPVQAWRYPGDALSGEDPASPDAVTQTLAHCPTRQRPQKNMSRPRPTEDIVDSLQQNEMPRYLLLFALKIVVPYVSLWICVRAGFFAQMARHLGNFKQRRSSLCMGYF